MSGQWSAAVWEQLERLSTEKRRAILRIVEAELQGVPLSHLLKTAYSCKYCGRSIGRSSMQADSRKQLLFEHQDNECDNRPQGDAPGVRWKFAVAASTYYSKWREDAAFWAALRQARREAAGLALDEAQQLLKVATEKAVAELVRQVSEGESDRDKRLSAVAILDRADMATAPIVNDGVRAWVEALREGSDADADNDE